MKYMHVRMCVCVCVCACVCVCVFPTKKSIGVSAWAYIGKYFLWVCVCVCECMCVCVRVFPPKKIKCVNVWVYVCRYLSYIYIYIYIFTNLWPIYIYVCVKRKIMKKIRFVYIYIYIYISMYHHVTTPARSLWPSRATHLYRLLLPVGLQGNILYRHRAVVYKFELVVLPLLVHVKGSTGVRPYFSSGVSHILFG